MGFTQIFDEAIRTLDKATCAEIITGRCPETAHWAEGRRSMAARIRAPQQTGKSKPSYPQSETPNEQVYGIPRWVPPMQIGLWHPQMGVLPIRIIA